MADVANDLLCGAAIDGSPCGRGGAHPFALSAGTFEIMKINLCSACAINAGAALTITSQPNVIAQANWEAFKAETFAAE